MPPYQGLPYGEAPFYSFVAAEISLYILFIICLIHAVRQGLPSVCYLAGALVFGLILEYINVVSNLGYTYGKFLVMFGRSPDDIPLCIGVGWSVIMYTARLFTDRLGLPLWSAAALDALLAFSIDLSMDTVAYRMHMWHWDWTLKGLNPLTADWFGVPFGNFFGWLLVVFFYSSLSRLLEKVFFPKNRASLKFLFVPVASVILSQVLLYAMLVYVSAFLKEQFGLTSLHRFISFLVILFIITLTGFRKRKALFAGPAPTAMWLVPLWFHLYFFAWLFFGGFYKENTWLVTAAICNLAVGLAVHFSDSRRTREAGTVAAGAYNL